MDIALDQNTGDLQIVSGDLQILTGSEEVAQLVRNNLSTFQGEWFLDESLGVPYLQSVLGQKRVNPITVNAVIKRAIQNTEGVGRIIQLDLDLDAGSRTLAVVTRFTTNLGEEVSLTQEI